MTYDDLFSPKVKIRVIWPVVSHFDNDSLALVGFIASARSPAQLTKFGGLTSWRSYIHRDDMAMLKPNISCDCSGPI